tara:strand:- start:50 stop:2476 length:2427 start_codon:yes stop_codon:yes gene_type:complete
MPEEIVIDTETWGTRELLEVIASRFFELGNEGSYPNSWEVRGIEGKDVSNQLEELNSHLDTMGLVGSLEETNPPVLIISRIPQGSNVMGNYQSVLMWAVMSVFLTMSGSHWVSEYGYGSNSSGNTEIMNSLIFFTIPIIVTLSIASYCRVLVARRFGIEIGHIAPIVFPIPTWWPFGIVGALGQRKLDMVPMPSRRALGSIELAVPLVLFIAGSFLTVIGLILTPSSPPQLTGPPTVFETSLISSSLADSLLGEHREIRLQWLHPIGISGVGLSLVGWIMMLPIPGLPGDRLLHAIIGPAEMRSGSTQTSVFLIVLFLMVVVFATAKWTPWIFLAFVAAWQRFNPDSLPQPIVLDEQSGLDERFKSRFVAIASVILLAGLPGSMPSYEMEDYIGGISTEEWQQEIEFSRGELQVISLNLEPEGVMPVSGWLQMRIEGSRSQEWVLSSDCSDFLDTCRFDEVTQAETNFIDISITPPEGIFSNHVLKLLIEISGFEVEHEIVLHELPSQGLIGPFWTLSGEFDKPVICTDFDAGDGGRIFVEGSYWESMNGSNLSSGIQELCLRGNSGAIQSSESFDSQGRSFGPVVFFESENYTEGPWAISIDGSEPSIQVMDGQWKIPSGFASTGDILYHSDRGSPFCPSSDVAAQVDTGENWSVEMGNYSSVRLEGNLSGNGSIGIGEEGWLGICGSDGSLTSYKIIEGPDIFVSTEDSNGEYSAIGLNHRIDVDSFYIFNRGSEKVSLSLEWHGDSPQSGIWEVSIGDWIDSGGSSFVEYVANGSSNLERALWVTADESGVVVHLSARCPSGGCE